MINNEKFIEGLNKATDKADYDKQVKDGSDFDDTGDIFHADSTRKFDDYFQNDCDEKDFGFFSGRDFGDEN